MRLICYNITMFDKNKAVLYIFILWAVSVSSFLLLNNNTIAQNIAKNAFYIIKNTNTKLKILSPPEEEKKSYLPDYVRGIYLTAYSAGNDEFRSHILSKIKDSRINTVVIDIKDYSGYILYDSQLEEVQNIKAKNNRIPDLAKTLKEFHDLDIYVIARQTVFQDPELARMHPELAIKTYNGNTWYDKSGLA